MLFVLLVLVASSRGTLLPLDAENLHATIGGYAVMNCHLDFPFGNEIPYHLQWDKDGEPIFSWYSGDISNAGSRGMERVADRWGGRVRRLADGDLGLGRGSINISSVRETDAGLYRCRVTFPNRSPPQRNNGTFYYLEVDGANVIVTPPMNATVMEGERAELECVPKSPEWTVEWFKEGTILSQMPELSARAIRTDNGSLVIPHTTSADAGEFECHVQATNGQMQSASAFLDVQFKAKVVYAPKERYLPYGKPASLDCYFSANPPLTNLRWEKDGFLFDPYNVPGVFYSRNGSLLFNQVDESHEGLYSCTPYNSLGSEGSSPAVRVRVQKPPSLTVKPQPLYLTRLGATVTMPCTASVNPYQAQPVVLWIRKEGAVLPEGRHSLIDGNLTITDVTEDDRGTYVCTARNDADIVSAETELLIENVPPRAPYNLTAVPSHETIHLSWVPGHNGLEVDYNVWYRERSVSEWRTMKILSLGVTDATLVGLRPGTEYELRVLSQDHIGDGLFSKPLFVRTLDQEVTAADATALAMPVTEGIGITSLYEDERLEVTVRLIEEGALVRWQRDELDESTCTLRWYVGEDPDRKIIFTGHTQHDYMIVSRVEEGERYWASVECGGASGGAALNVPAYWRLRAVALGCAGGALLLATLAAAAYYARGRFTRTIPPPPPPRADKRRR